ncbi:hypothetical protein BDZ97DRAFT_1762015 [Flammula alnicola]|nr:hypothetical protein BDZ97DRAFT_1762015 [Flammula alnicola]
MATEPPQHLCLHRRISDSEEEGDIPAGSTPPVTPIPAATGHSPSPWPITSQKPVGGPASSTLRAPHIEEADKEAVIHSVVADRTRNCTKVNALPPGVDSSEESEPEEEVKSKKRKGRGDGEENVEQAAPKKAKPQHSPVKAGPSKVKGTIRKPKPAAKKV